MNSKQVERAIQKSAKKVIIESGIASSRAGNKELKHLATKLASQPASRLEAAQMLGTQLGQRIVELSQKSNKQNLDAGIIRLLIRTKAVPSVTDLPTEVLSDASVTVDSQENSIPAAIAPQSQPQKAQPIAQADDEQETESSVSPIETTVTQAADSEIDVQPEADLDAEASELSQTSLEVAPEDDVAAVTDSDIADTTSTVQESDDEEESDSVALTDSDAADISSTAQESDDEEESDSVALTDSDAVDTSSTVQESDDEEESIPETVQN